MPALAPFVPNRHCRNPIDSVGSERLAGRPRQECEQPPAPLAARPLGDESDARTAETGSDTQGQPSRSQGSGLLPNAGARCRDTHCLHDRPETPREMEAGTGMDTRTPFSQSLTIKAFRFQPSRGLDRWPKPVPGPGLQHSHHRQIPAARPRSAARPPRRRRCVRTEFVPGHPRPPT